MKLVIPADLWQSAMRTLRQPPHDRERVAYLDGPRARDGVGVATTLTVPSAHQDRGHFEVSAEEMSRAGRHLRVLGLMRLAQIHSHPSGWTGHSAYDDQMAFSQRDDALSLVVPHFAGCAPGLADCGVHMREAHGWRELHPDEKAVTVQIVPSTIDLRS